MKRKLLSLVLALSMLLSLTGNVFANDASQQKSVVVSFSAQAENAFLCAPQINKEIKSDLAESFGYSDKVTDGVSALDVLVSAHIEVFGSDFNAQNCNEYLKLNGSTISKIFGTETSGCGFFINGTQPHNDVLNESPYGNYYTGYMIDESVVSNGDFVEFAIYQDEYALDNYVSFEQNSKKISLLEIAQNTTVSLTLKGYSIGWYGCNTDEDILKATKPLADVKLCTIDKNSGAATDIKDAVTDENGVVKVSFSEIGEYYLSAYVSQESIDDSETPVIMPLLKVNVTKPAPKFEKFEFLTSGFSDWKANTTFSPDVTEYNLHVKSATVKKITVQRTTAYDESKYTAFAAYKDADGNDVKVDIPSEKLTFFENIPFGDFKIEVTICDKEDENKKTVYTFMINRPYDTTKTIKDKGISVTAHGREVSAAKYNGELEGTMFKADENANILENEKTGVTATHYNYKTFILNSTDEFTASFESKSEYSHIRYSTDNENWTELKTNSGKTEVLTIGSENKKVLKIQVLDDETYRANIAAGNDGFFETEPTEYTVYVEKIDLNEDDAKILSASSQSGDWYPSFKSDRYSYQIVVPNGTEVFPSISFTISENASAKLENDLLTADENGVYTIELTKKDQTVNITSQSGLVISYKFKALAKSKYDVPDKVVDYFCIGSQYTNITFGILPEATLAASLKSLGSFGGYITYYYENPITDDPNNKYGIDFYVYGNSFTDGGSAAEPGQVYVSEDNKTWYALAGSEHYSDALHTDYTITYTKDENGKATWTDNKENSSSKQTNWPLASNYYLNDFASQDSYTYTGIVLDSNQGTITGDGTTAAFSGETKFGYADYYANGTIGADVNPYVLKPAKSNGFDLKWAVDENKNPIDVSDKEFHYIKIATASNIWAGAFNEKSTEITQVVRTIKQESEVGKTKAPSSVTVFDSVSEKVINLNDNQTIYDVNTDDLKYASIKLNNADAEDNIYVNNTRIAYNEAAYGFKIVKGKKTLVRIIVQNGDKEPCVYLLRLTSNQPDSESLIEALKVNVGGNSKQLTATDGKNYTLNVGYKIDSFSFTPVLAQGISYTVNGDEPKESYDLAYGENTFEITASDENSNTQTVTLKVTRANEPSSPSSKNITVYFTLYGDDLHGSGGDVHTYQKTKSSLKVWIERKAYTLPADSTVLDLFEKALTQADISWTNEGGNYISEINDLAEFDNGTNSGWMYLLNNKHPSYGVAEQGIKNGDNVIFHYTDDYTLEEGSEKWNSGWNSSSGNGSTGDDKKDDSKKDDDTKKDDEQKNDDKKDDNKPSNPFKDVKDTDWFFDDVCKAYETGIISGTKEDEFSPLVNVDRAMFITMLYRLDKQTQTGETAFEDVDKNAYYNDAVFWATQNGITYGISENKFAPSVELTREQAAAILYRYAEYKGYDLSKSQELTNFIDSDKISLWAQEPLKWAVANELIKGTETDKLSADSFATRAQITAILIRFVSMFK